MPRRRREEEQDLFAGMASASHAPTASSEEAEDEDELPDPSPSRRNALGALAIADDATDFEEAGYYVQRAIAESLLLLVDLLAARQTNPPSS